MVLTPAEQAEQQALKIETVKTIRDFANAVCLAKKNSPRLFFKKNNSFPKDTDPFDFTDSGCTFK